MPIVACSCREGGGGIFSPEDWSSVWGLFSSSIFAKILRKIVKHFYKDLKSQLYKSFLKILRIHGTNDVTLTLMLFLLKVNTFEGKITFDSKSQLMHDTF